MWKLYYHPETEHKAWVVVPAGTEMLVTENSIEYWTLEDNEANPPKCIFDASTKDHEPYKYRKLELHGACLEAERLNMRDYGKPY